MASSFSNTISFNVLIFFISGYASEDALEVNVKVGESVPLQCQGPTHAPIEVLKWIRSDLVSDGYVLFYRDELLHPSYQHPSFVGRVELRDPEMKDGDVSVILKNVTTSDAGTYECHISVSSAGRKRRAYSELRCIINLEVSGDTHWYTWYGPLLWLEEHPLMCTGLVSIILIFVGGISYVVIKKC